MAFTAGKPGKVWVENDASCPVFVSGTVTTTTDGLTDAELRATPVPVSGTVGVSGTVPVSLATAPTTPVTGTFWQATQPISGTVGISGTVPVSLATAPTTPVTGTFWQATQPVSIAATVAVSGTFWQATQPVSGTVTANAGSGTMAVSVASLPLPSGASTAAKQPALGTAGSASADVLSVQGVASMTALKVDGSAVTQPVSGTVTANAGSGTMAVSVASLPLPSGASTAAKQPALGTAGSAATDVLSVQGIASMTALKVDGSAVTQPISGSVTVASGSVTVSQGTAANLQAQVGGFTAAGASPGGNPVQTGGAFNTTQPTWTNGTVVAFQGTARGAQIVSTGADTFNVTINAALPAGTAVIGALSAHQSTNIDQIAGTTPDTNSGSKSAGTLRVVLATDQPALTNKLLVTPDANSAINVAQVNGSTTVASVTGVQDVMPRKRTGSTGLSPNYSASHITTKTTTNVTASTAYISAIAICVTGAGSSQTLTIVNKEATPKTLYTAGAAIAIGNTYIQFPEPVLMTSGIDIVSAGTTAGTQDVFVTYWQ